MNSTSDRFDSISVHIHNAHPFNRVQDRLNCSSEHSVGCLALAAQRLQRSSPRASRRVTSTRGHVAAPGQRRGVQGDTAGRRRSSTDVLDLSGHDRCWWGAGAITADVGGVLGPLGRLLGPCWGQGAGPCCIQCAVWGIQHSMEYVCACVSAAA
jgi:hypothetical protein